MAANLIDAITVVPKQLQASLLFIGHFLSGVTGKKRMERQCLDATAAPSVPGEVLTFDYRRREIRNPLGQHASSWVGSPLCTSRCGFSRRGAERQCAGRGEDLGTDAALPGGHSGGSNAISRNQHGTASISAHGFNQPQPPEGGIGQLSLSARIFTPGASFFAERRKTSPGGLRKNARAMPSLCAQRVRQSPWSRHRTAKDALPRGPSTRTTHRPDGPMAARQLHRGYLAANSSRQKLSLAASLIRRSVCPVCLANSLTGKSRNPRFAVLRRSLVRLEQRFLLGSGEAAPSKPLLLRSTKKSSIDFMFNLQKTKRPATSLPFGSELRAVGYCRFE